MRTYLLNPPNLQDSRTLPVEQLANVDEAIKFFETEFRDQKRSDETAIHIDEKKIKDYSFDDFKKNIFIPLLKPLLTKITESI